MLTAKENVEKRTRLEREALDACAARGHTMGPWDRCGGLSHDTAKCRTCRCQVEYNTEPPPNGVDISGRAVAIDCTSQQETVRLAFASYGHLLDADTVTYADFAEKIRATYDLDNMRNWAVYYAVRYRGSDLLDRNEGA